MSYRIRQAVCRPGTARLGPVVARRAPWVIGGLTALALSGCGGGASTSSQSPSPTTTSAKAAPVSSRLTCGQFCRQAGPEGGPNSDGCQRPNGKPYSNQTSNGCLPCPAQDCMDVLSSTATAGGGAVTVALRCRVSIACDGALLLLQPKRQTASDGSKLPPGEWVAGSDIRVAPGATATVAVKLTRLGERLIRSPGGYRAAITIQIRVYGTVGYALHGPGPTLLIRG